MSNAYIWASFITITIILVLVGYLAWRDTKISYEIKELGHTWDELKKIEDQPKSWLD